MNTVSKKESRFVKNLFTVTAVIVYSITTAVLGFMIGYTLITVI